MPRNIRHLQRIGRSSGFALHYRNLGVNQDIMDRWIQRYYRHQSNLLQQISCGTEFNALMGAEAIAHGDYRPDRAHSLYGAAAYDREKKKYMKDLGLARNDDIITEKMLQYIRILESGEDKISFLRQQAMRIKLFCPQTNVAKWTPRQNGYAHYRLRPLAMILYAVEFGNELEVDVNTDDIVLSAFCFFTPFEQTIVDEEFIRLHIREYFEKKLSGGINYLREFEMLMDRVENDLRINLRAYDTDAFKRKCRNAANDSYCAIIFIRYLNLVNSPKKVPLHWSSTQQAYGNTPPVPEYNTIELTDIGRRFLTDSLNMIPIWYKDVQNVFGRQCFKEIEIINTLGLRGQYPKNCISDQQRIGLENLGIKLVINGGFMIPEKTPLFDLQYDMH